MPISGACALESLKSLICHATEGVEHTHTHTHPFNGPLSRTTRVSGYQKGKTNLDFTEARDSEWQWHQLGHMQVCTSLQTDNHASTPPLSFLQAGCPSWRPTNSVKARKEYSRPSIRQWLRGGHIMISTEWQSARASRPVRRNVQWMPMRRCGRDTALS